MIDCEKIFAKEKGNVKWIPNAALALSLLNASRFNLNKIYIEECIVDVYYTIRALPVAFPLYELH